MTAHLYDLSSSWTLPHSQQEVWEIIANPDMAWPDWWPGCIYAKPPERSPLAGTSNENLLLATTANLKFKAPLAYTLVVSYHPTPADNPREVAFDAGGDLTGDGRLVLTTIDIGHTRMDIEWRARPTSRWTTIISPVAAPAHSLTPTPP